MNKISVENFILQLLPRPKLKTEIKTRKAAERAYIRALKFGIKAENHYYNVNTLRNKSLFGFEYGQQLLRTEMREQDCSVITKQISDFFAKKPKLKQGKSQYLAEMNTNLKSKMEKLRLNLKSLKEFSNSKNNN